MDSPTLHLISEALLKTRSPFPSTCRIYARDVFGRHEFTGGSALKELEGAAAAITARCVNIIPIAPSWLRALNAARCCTSVLQYGTARRHGALPPLHHERNFCLSCVTELVRLHNRCVVGTATGMRR